MLPLALLLGRLLTPTPLGVFLVPVIFTGYHTLSFFQDENGIYHTRKYNIQSFFGFNEVYDFYSESVAIS